MFLKIQLRLSLTQKRNIVISCKVQITCGHGNPAVLKYEGFYELLHLQLVLCFYFYMIHECSSKFHVDIYIFFQFTMIS